MKAQYMAFILTYVVHFSIYKHHIFYLHMLKHLF